MRIAAHNRKIVLYTKNNVHLTTLNEIVKKKWVLILRPLNHFSEILTKRWPANMFSPFLWGDPGNTT